MASKYLRDFLDTDTLNVFYPEVEVGFELVEEDTRKSIKKFTENTLYKAGEVVIYLNKFYSAKTDFTSTSIFNTGDWDEIVVSSEQTVKLWSNSTSYVIGNYVIYNGRMFFAIANNLNQIPDLQSQYWELAEGERELDNANKNSFLSGEVYKAEDVFNYITFRNVYTTGSDQTNKANRRIVSCTLYPFVYDSTKHYAEQLTFSQNQVVINLSTFKFYKLKVSSLQKTTLENPVFTNTTNWEEIGINLDNYYTKSQIDTFFTNYYTKTEIDNNFYNKLSIDSLLTETLSIVKLGGFVYNNDIQVFYNSATKQITLQNLTTKLDAYYNGEEIPEFKNQNVWVSTAHPDVTANYFLYYGPTGFVWSTTPWDYSYCQIAYVNYNIALDNKFAIAERHGLVMDPESHKEFHDTIGTYLTGGADLSGYVLNSTTVANRRPNVSQTFIKDEDNQHNLPALTNKLYTSRQLLGPTLRILSPLNPDIVSVDGGTGRPFWNSVSGGVWGQTIMNNNEYQAIFLVAVPVSEDLESQEYRYLWVQGQQVSTDLNTIRNLTPASLTHGDGLSTEYVFIGKVIIRSTSNNWVITEVTKLTGTRINQVASTQLGTYLSFVTTDSSLEGAGTVASPLSLNDSYVNGLIDAKNLLSEVETDLTLTGNGTTATPLSAEPYVSNEISDHNLDTNSHSQIVLNTIRSNKDSNGIFTTIELKRPDNTLFLSSVLSNLSAGNYLTRTETIYLADGITVQQTNIYDLTYDIDGELLTETKI